MLEANFTAPVNAELRVGAITETVTVTGETPVVDVQNTMRREVVTRELLDTLPTGRDFQTIGNVLPGVTMGRFDVGGSSTAQSGTLVAFGSRGADFQLKIDGMHANNSFGEGWFNGIYHNEAAFQEMAYTVSGGNAENQAAGVSVNMIPRTGGNAYAYESSARTPTTVSRARTSTTRCAPGDSTRRPAACRSCGTSTATSAGRSSATACGSSRRPGTGASRKTSPTSSGSSPIPGWCRPTESRQPTDHAGVLRRPPHDSAGADPPDRQLTATGRGGGNTSGSRTAADRRNRSRSTRTRRP